MDWFRTVCYSTQYMNSSVKCYMYMALLCECVLYLSVFDCITTYELQSKTLPVYDNCLWMCDVHFPLWKYHNIQTPVQNATGIQYFSLNVSWTCPSFVFHILCNLPYTQGASQLTLLMNGKECSGTLHLN